MNPTSAFVAAALAAAAFAPLGAGAQTAYVQRSQIIGADQDVHLYGLPTKDSAGKALCYDTTIALTVGANGKPDGTAAVTAVACPKAKVNQFVPGVYASSSWPGNCTIAASPFAGRTELDLHCVRSEGPNLDVVWYTGAITGNPLEASLKAAALDKVPGDEQYAWGRVSRADSGYSWWGSCLSKDNLISARQVGDTLTLGNYGNDNTWDCQVVLIKQP